MVNEIILRLAKQSCDHSYNALRLAIKRKRLDINMAFCRKIFATHLRNYGIEQEIIDLLQGRLPKSVFTRHYFKPDFNYDRIRGSLDSLYKVII